MSHLAAALLVLMSAGTSTPVSAPLHPHYSKKVEVSLRSGPTLSVSHLTATFDEEGAAKMKAGEAWHLANGKFETSQPLTVGGNKVEAGQYSLKARKTQDSWELVLDQADSFARKISEKAVALSTSLKKDAPLCEHLHIDIQPSGDKTSTKLYLEVRFDHYLARCEIVVP